MVGKYLCFNPLKYRLDYRYLVKEICVRILGYGKIELTGKLTSNSENSYGTVMTNK